MCVCVCGGGGGGGGVRRLPCLCPPHHVMGSSLVDTGFCLAIEVAVVTCLICLNTTKLG